MVIGCALTGFIVVWVLSNADQRPHKRPVWLCRQDRAASVRRPQPYAGHGRKGRKKTVRTASRVAARSLQKRLKISTSAKLVKSAPAALTVHVCRMSQVLQCIMALEHALRT